MLSVLVPHLNYIKVLIYRGYVLESTQSILGVKERLIQENFNAIPDSDYQEIYNEIMSRPWAKTMIEENREIMRYNSTALPTAQEYPKSHENIKGLFRSGHRFEDALISDISVKTLTGRRKRGHFAKAKAILYDRRKRSYLENSLTMGIPLKEIVDGWNMTSSKTNTLHYNTISQYSYFFWNVRDRESLHVSRDGKLAVKLYLNLDRDNFFYDDHRELVFSNREEYRQVFGIVTAEERDKGKQQMLGSLYKYISKELNSSKGKPIRKDFLDFYMYLDRQQVDLSNVEMDGKEQVEEIERIKSRVTVVKEERLSLDQLRDEYVPPEDIEQDAPAELRMKK